MSFIGLLSFRLPVKWAVSGEVNGIFFARNESFLKSDFVCHGPVMSAAPCICSDIFLVITDYVINTVN